MVQIARCGAFTIGTGGIPSVIPHPTRDFVHRFAPAVALAGEQREHVGLAGLLAGAEAWRPKTVTARAERELSSMASR